MKYTFLAAVLTLGTGLLATAQNNSKAVINGDIGNIQPVPENILIMYSDNGKRVMDTISIKGGKYKYTAELAEPVMVRMQAAYAPVVAEDGSSKQAALRQSRDLITVFIEPGAQKISSTDSFSNIKVKSSSAHDSYEALNKRLKPHNEKMSELVPQYNAMYRAKDQAGMDALRPELEAIQQAIKDEHKKFVIDNPNSPVALYALTTYAGYDIDPEEIEPLFYKLPVQAQNSPSAQAFRERMDIAKKTAVGSYAMDFTQNDTLGKPVSLSSFKGKYVLIDFWASWCGPCRVENPNVVKAYQTYKDKGFDVLGISLDRANDKDKWIKAIHADELTWTHVSDLKYWDNEVAKQYGIRAIPQNLLVGPDGKIIAKNLRGEVLQQKLEELFGSTNP